LKKGAPQKPTQYSAAMAKPDILRIRYKTNKVLKDYGHHEINGKAEEILAISASIKASQDLRIRGAFALIGTFSFIAAWIASGGGFTLQYFIAFLAVTSISGIYSFFTIIDVGSRDAASSILNNRASKIG